MTPFFFGTGHRRLFGVYEPAAVASLESRAAIICPPWGPEYLYAHRALRQLAIRLSGAGFHTLRFDYFGTGDSAGDMIDADLAGWEDDLEMAMEEVRDIVGKPRLTLIGLRLGATIAARVCARRAGEIEALVLWDPVISGEDDQLGTGARARVGRDPDASREETVEIGGFTLTRGMLDDFHAIDVRGLLSTPSTRSLLMVSERLTSHGMLHPVATSTGGGSLDIVSMKAVHPWTEAVSAAGLVPASVIQKIAEWL